MIEPIAERPAAQRTLGTVIDPGAIFAGWVGIGMAVVLVIAFALVLAVQALVFIGAPLAGLLIGWYANARSQRRRPRWRVLLNSGYAGLLTALSVALMYVAIRLLFVYADSGLRPDRTQIDCRTGPECSYARHLEAGQEAELASLGITDSASFEAAVLREQGLAGSGLFVLTLGGSLLSGAGRALGRARDPKADSSANSSGP